MDSQPTAPEDWPLFDSRRPEFASPPVIEVALSVQFVPLTTLTTAQLGLLWGCFRDEFPDTEDQPPLPHIVEAFDGALIPPPTIEILSEPQLPRCWFKSSSDPLLIQVQRDRFVFNWRQSGSREPYPRYPTVRERFQQHFRKFERWVSDAGVGPIVPDQCEVTYVNHIVSDDGKSQGQLVPEIFATWTGLQAGALLSAPEDIGFQIRHRIESPSGHPLGRLHIRVEPRVEIATGRQLLRLVLTARGAPPTEDLPGILMFFDLGREYIVRGFTEITSEAAHRAWGRIDVQ